MPVLNGEAHIADQLAALATQTYDGDWELVVSDNGCSDRTMEIVERWRPRLPSLTVADASARKGLNYARNTGAYVARGDFLALCDADDVVTPGWLAAIAEASQDTDIVSGRMEWDELNDPVVRSWRPQAPMTDLVVGHGFLRYAPGGNMGVWTHLARRLRWDEQFTYGSSDYGFAWRAQLAGYRLAFAHDALIQQRFRGTIRAMASQHFRYGRSGPLLHRAYSYAGLPDPDNRQALEEWRRLVTTLSDLWTSRERRGRWVRAASFRLGRLVGSLRAGILCL